MTQDLLIVDEVLQSEAQGLFGLQPAVLELDFELFHGFPLDFHVFF